MKKILFAMTILVMATTGIHAQLNYAVVNVSNATLLQPAGSYIFYGDQVMDKKDCAEFLSTRHQPAYETFQSGLKCYTAGWWTFGAGLVVDLAGSILWAFAPEENNEAMFYSGASLVIAGGLAVIASVPTIFVGYVRMNRGIDTFNMSQVASTPQAYWTIQGSQNGIGLAFNF